ncbi:MAG: adenosylmethionine decarboxylase [Bacteroidota bacterium]
MTGLGKHLLIEYEGCPAERLNQVGLLEDQMIAAAQAAGATVIHSVFHHFSPQGISGVVVIQESHLSIHTWPELGYAAVDVFTCGEQVDPWKAQAYLQAQFQASSVSTQAIDRGLVPAAEQTLEVLALKRERWFTARSEGMALSFLQKGHQIFEQQSPWQQIKVFESQAYGKMLVLDEEIGLSEADEHIYHEMLVHVPVQLAPASRKVLVLGGGDGGVVRQLLRYQELTAIDVWEIDPAIPEVVGRFFPHLQQALTDPRVALKFGDAFSRMTALKQGHYDLIWVDIPTVKGQETGLIHQQIIGQLKHLLAPQGMLIGQGALPRFDYPGFQQTLGAYHAEFGPEKVFPYLAHIPTVPGGTRCFVLCSLEAINPRTDFDQEAAAMFAAHHQLGYYHPGIHQAAFILPRDLQGPQG